MKDRILQQLQRVPVWARPIVGLIAIPIFIVSLPLIFLALIGMTIWGIVEDFFDP